MKKYIVEYKTYWSGGVIDREQTLNIDAESKEDATKIGKEKLDKMDEENNRFVEGMVYRDFYRCVEEDKFRYLSSAKEPALNGFQGHIDVTKWKGL